MTTSARAATGVASVAGACAIAAVVVNAVPVAVCAVAGSLVAAGVAIATRRRRPPLPAATNDPHRDLAALEAAMAGKVPQAIQARVDRIARIVRETLPRLDQLGPGSAAAHAVMATATNYLPDAVGAYLRLPRDYADRRPVSRGRTSLMVLCDQLDLLADKMDEVFVAVCQSDVDALVAHGRFLAEKFGSGSLSLGTRNARGGP